MYEYKLIDDPKMLRETLCAAQASLHRQNPRRREHSDRIQRLIDECDRHRPLGPDGKHGELHTKSCGCDVNIHYLHPVDHYPLCWPMDKEGEFVGVYEENEVGCPDCLKELKE